MEIANSIEVFTPSSHDEWLAKRRPDITASQIAALVDQHPYCTRLQIFLEKTGRKKPDYVSDTPAMERGRLLEGIAYRLACEQLPGVTLQYNSANQYWRDRELRIGCTPDVIAVDGPDGRGVIQLKSVEPNIFRRTWEHGEPPTWVALQCLTEAKLLGASWAKVGALRVGHAVEFDLLPVPLATAAWDILLEAVADFWRQVAADTPPPTDYGRDAELIAAMNGESDSGTAIDLSSDNHLIATLYERENCKELLRGLEKEIEAADAEIRDKAGAAEVITAGDFRVTLRTEEMKGYTVAPRTRRPIRVKRIRGEPVP